MKVTGLIMIVMQCVQMDITEIAQTVVRVTEVVKFAKIVRFCVRSAHKVFIYMIIHVDNAHRNSSDIMVHGSVEVVQLTV